MVVFKNLFFILQQLPRFLWNGLNHRVVTALAMVVLPLGYGAYSWSLGQDMNWDLLNYHLYNPFALLNGKIGLDLAPGQWQSYFSPAIDLLPYLLYLHLPAQLVGFIVGYLHGLDVVLVFIVANRLLLDSEPTGSRRRRALFLACAGGLGAGFLMEVGNSMGDNLAALGILASLALLTHYWQTLSSGSARGVGLSLLAGLACGIATGLKLTNATYALAMCLAFFCLPGKYSWRLRAAFVFGCGVLVGICSSAGYWYWKMWQVFHNPLFPQFNDRFHAPLANPMGIGDTSWLPQGWLEKLLWPFIFTFYPHRVIEIKLTQIIWPLLYIAFFALLVKILVDLLSKTVRKPLPAPTRFVLLFFGLAYLIWMNLFSIYRYLIPLELLAPLMFWIILRHLLAESAAIVTASILLVLATLHQLPLGDWGHTTWSDKAFKINAPVLPQPQESIIFTTQADPPLGWVVSGLPPSLAVVSVGNGFPESQSYHARMIAMLDQRRGPFYVMLNVDRPNPDVQASEAARGVMQEKNTRLRVLARDRLAPYGLYVDPAAPCQPFEAFIGANRWNYDLCLVTRR